MRLVVLTVVVCMAVADRLENTYLPPFSAKTASGSNLLVPPLLHGGALSSSYIAPVSGAVPSEVYNTPSIRTYSGHIGGAPVAILRFNNDNTGDGTYRFEYETQNRISQQESGQFRSTGADQGTGIVQGTYSYAGPDGVTYTVNYVADENGFRASGDHLPTPPPIPEAIQKSLEINAGTRTSGYSSSFSTSEPSSRQYLAPNSLQSTGYRY